MTVTIEYEPATDTRGARFLARSEGRPTRTMPYDYGVDDPYSQAAADYAARYCRPGAIVRVCQFRFRAGAYVFMVPDLK